mmetsp:Transcript_51683/g.145644  ORF Transcript_51683/g.145644 Transcript_51683/m.145644 type:complete len:312 (+) Transcript_51683:214-1149(+)
MWSLRATRSMILAMLSPSCIDSCFIFSKTQCTIGAPMVTRITVSANLLPHPGCTCTGCAMKHLVERMSPTFSTTWAPNGPGSLWPSVFELSSSPCIRPLRSSAMSLCSVLRSSCASRRVCPSSPPGTGTRHTRLTIVLQRNMPASVSVSRASFSASVFVGPSRCSSSVQPRRGEPRPFSVPFVEATQAPRMESRVSLGIAWYSLISCRAIFHRSTTPQFSLPIFIFLAFSSSSLEGPLGAWVRVGDPEAARGPASSCMHWSSSSSSFSCEGDMVILPMNAFSLGRSSDSSTSSMKSGKCISRLLSPPQNSS